MTDSPDFLPEIRAVVARYLDGGDDFDAAAQSLASQAAVAVRVDEPGRPSRSYR